MVTLVKTILVVGASGFIGSRIAIAATQRAGLVVRTFTRRKVGSFPESPVGNLLDLNSLKAAVEGVDVIFHAASYVGADAHTAWAVNVTGTQNLIEAASESNSPRIIYVSTTGVYGNGPHSRRRDTAVTRPTSFRSETRALAERIVLDAGGAVVRPNLVYGVGDRWVVPAITRLMRLAGTSHLEFSAPLSVISCEQLAYETVRFGVDADQSGRAIVHGCTPRPSSMVEIMREINSFLQVPMTPRLARSLHTAAEELGMSEHQLNMLTEESTFDPIGFWDPASNAPGFHLDSNSREWYRSLHL